MDSKPDDENPEGSVVRGAGLWDARFCWSSPPIEVKGSFFRVELFAPFGISQHTLFYLAPAGTCKKLLDKDTFDTETHYAPSESGSYVYARRRAIPARRR